MSSRQTHNETKGDRMRYRVNSEQVISETAGGETIIVNLATGHYFTLQGTAVDVWEALQRDEPQANVVAELEGRYAAADGEIEEAVSQLLGELEAASLVVSENGGPSGPAEVRPRFDGEREPFAPPGFTAYTDMQDIILLDPVHEVDPRGWPHEAPAGA